MRILLVAINAKYIHSNPAVFSLKSCSGIYEPYIDILEFTINQQSSFILQQIYQKHPDVIAFSCYIWNRSTTASVISDLHKILPDADIWVGGPEVSYNAEEVIQEWQLRGVMAGPGEGSFSRLVSAYMTGQAGSLPAVLDETNTRRLTLNEIPFWYKDLTDFENRIIYYESSRGCPFSCSYCLSSIDKTLDFRSAPRVCQELDFFLEQKVPQVKFVDRTFNCKKSHALPILQHILEHDNGITNFHFEITADLLDEDYFTLLKQMRPGAVQLEIGIQSTCDAVITEIKRTMDFKKTAAAVNLIRSWNNIHIHLDLIAGLPYEDFQTFQTSFHDVYDLRPEQLQLGFLKVLKGSYMESQAPAYGLIYTSQPPYEVLADKWLPYEDVCRLKQVEEMVDRYYNSGQFSHTLEFLRPYFSTAFAMYEALASWHEKHRLSAIQPSRIRKYEILLEFAAAHITVSHSCPKDSAGFADSRLAVCAEYLTYDLYLREHIKNRPSFAIPLERWKEAIRDLLMEESQTHARFPELDGCNYRELTKAIHVEVFPTIFPKPAITLFYYGKRNPLTNNCTTYTENLQLTKELAINNLCI